MLLFIGVYSILYELQGVTAISLETRWSSSADKSTPATFGPGQWSRRGNNLTEKQSIFDLAYLQNQCQYADTCLKKGKEVPNRSKTSCCLPCSCSPSCEDFGNCCDKNKMSHSKCHSAVIDRNQTFITKRSYLMIDRCLAVANETDCKARSLEPWGSLYPVYDAAADRIFYNRACAECSGVVKYTHWDLVVNCPKTDYFSHEQFFGALLGEQCAISFKPPKKVVIEKHICYEDSISRCNVTGKWKVYDAELERTCLRWNSPVADREFSRTIYANVFCKLCNGFEHDPELLCIKIFSKTDVETFSFSTVINYRKISDVLPLTDAKKAVSEETCGIHTVKHPSKNECRSVLCPDGYIRSDKGCLSIASLLLKQGYFIQVKLTPTTDRLLPWSYIQELSAEQKQDTNSWFDLKGLVIDVYTIYGEVADIENVTYAKSLIVRFGRKKYPIYFDKEVKAIKKAILKSWEINLRGERYPFSVEIYKFGMFVFDGRMSRVNVIDRLNDQRTSYYDPLKLYEAIDFANRLSFYKDIAIFRKVNFCMRVRLAASEWVAGYDEITLSPNITSLESRRVLGDSEFSIYLDEFGRPVVDICVENFNSDYMYDDNLMNDRSNYDATSGTMGALSSKNNLKVLMELLKIAIMVLVACIYLVNH